MNSLAGSGLAVQGLAGLDTTRLSGALVRGGLIWFNLEVLRLSLALVLVVLVLICRGRRFSLWELAEASAGSPSGLVSVRARSTVARALERCSRI